MSPERARTAAHPARPAGLLVLVVVSAALIGYRILDRTTMSLTPRPSGDVRSHHPAVPGEADGVVPDGVTAFDNQYPAVARLNPALRSALRRATTDAAGDGVQIVVNSGWRSPKYQEQLLLEAITTYGSRQAAARWVASPSASAHVQGRAVDLGPARAAAWLSRHGARYGLCQIYRDEAWHYERRPAAVRDGCPPLYADPTHDPRLK